MKKLRAAAYCRVSTNKDEQLDSYEAQQTFFRDYCERTNYRLIEIYGDEGKSGTKMKNRTQLLRLLDNASRNQFDVILIKDPSRLARNVVDFLTAVRKLRALGVQVIFVNYDLSSSDSSEFMLTMLSAIAQEESANMSKRVKFGKRINAEKGRVPNLVYGYNKTAGEYFSLSINDVEAAIVREIFERYASEEMGASLIATDLNRRGYKTKRNCAFTQKAITSILSNPLYTGRVVNGKQEVSDFLTGTRTDRDTEDWLITQRPELRIVSDELFDQAQQIRASRLRAYAVTGDRVSNRYLFSGLLRCKCCGRHFARVSRTYKNTYVRWCCTNRMVDGKQVCVNKTKVQEEELEAVIREYLASLLEKQPDITKLMAEEFERCQSQSSGSDTLVTIQKEITKLERNKDKLIELFNDDILTREELKARTVPLNAQLASLQSKADTFTSGVSTEEYMQQLKTLFGDIRTLLSKGGLTNGLLRQIIEDIVVDENGAMEIILKEIDAPLTACDNGIETT